MIHATLAHEEEITRQCNELAAKAHDMKDYNLVTLALKYCAEQIEEMQKSYDLVNLLETFGTDKVALKLLDEQLGDF